MFASDSSKIITILKRQIEDVKPERLLIIAERECKIENYMAQL